MQEERIRYYLVDGIRGIAIFNMVLFHFLYDVYIMYEKSPTWYSLPAIHIWQQMICRTFIFISGFVWTWGKERNLQRGVIFNFFGFLISFITLVIVPAQTIWFGILNFMGCAILLLLPMEKLLKKIPAAFGMAICFFCSCFAGKYNLDKLEYPVSCKFRFQLYYTVSKYLHR